MLNSEGLSRTLKKQKQRYSLKVLEHKTDQNNPASPHKHPLNSINSIYVKNAFGLVKDCHQDLWPHSHLKALVAFALESNRKVSEICGNMENCNS